MAEKLKTGSDTAVGFVQMESDEQGEAAITALDGFPHRGLPLVVRWALPGQDVGLNLSRMFESMNVPLEEEGQRLRGPVRDDRGECGGGGDNPANTMQPDRRNLLTPPGKTFFVDTETLGPHRATYDAVFQHPISRNLQWRDVRAMLVALSDVTERHDGVMKFSRNGHSLVVRWPSRKDFSDVQVIMQVRHFLEKFDAPPAQDASEGLHLLVVLDRREGKVFKTEMHGSIPQRITPYDPHLSHRQLHHVENDSDGRRKAGLRAYYDAIVKTLAGARNILIFSSSTGSGSAMDYLLAQLKEHHPDLARRVAGARVINVRHMSDDQLLAEARAYYAARGSPGSLPQTERSGSR
jgi:hypothetical protein